MFLASNCSAFGVFLQKTPQHQFQAGNTNPGTVSLWFGWGGPAVGTGGQKSSSTAALTAGMKMLYLWADQIVTRPTIKANS